ncbi:MAG: hypothetical protein R3F28_12280, partial [Candidatus Kapaibacterium sp.]
WQFSFSVVRWQVCRLCHRPDTADKGQGSKRFFVSRRIALLRARGKKVLADRPAWCRCQRIGGTLDGLT